MCRTCDLNPRYKFVENLDCIKENLDATLIDDLYKRNNIKPIKTG